MGDVIVADPAGLALIPLLFGLLGAFKLLTVQATGFRDTTLTGHYSGMAVFSEPCSAASTSGTRRFE